MLVENEFFCTLDVEDIQHEEDSIKYSLAVSCIKLCGHIAEAGIVVIHRGGFDFAVELLFDVALIFHTSEVGITFPILYSSQAAIASLPW